MEVISYPYFPAHLSRAYIALYTSVTDAGSLRSRIINAATLASPEGDQERELLNFAFVDPRLITSALHVETAVYQAILAAAQGSLRTKTVHSEVLWALNPGNNISEAIRRYGVSDGCTSLLVIRIDSSELQDVEAKMGSVVSGQLVPLTQLGTLTDWAAVKKYHKLNQEAAIKAASGDIQKEHDVVDNIVVSSVAIKSVMG
ncbi:CGI-121-domain-containing protein [Neolentinus lepideus HHB14362 ss-1]|uniref:EKC/KEOPS complex subunit CGI121 n=1 Tax=Neolentinus lepideus HHB14362 ss-1 TaxID=1314782 RepID=A0A165PLZ3_9AGAM|nr:CGI-121-domain-containing protein [Neolentinus lepideus HHB14362 ss-1]